MQKDVEAAQRAQGSRGMGQEILAQTMVEEKVLRQYVSVLAGKADIQGIDLNGTDVPLVQ